MMIYALPLRFVYILLAISTVLADVEITTEQSCQAQEIGDLEVPPGHQRCKVDEDGNCIDKSCIDRNDNCEKWASAGECDANSKYMLNFCKKSCEVCDYMGNLTELIILRRRLHEVGGDETLLETPYGMKQSELGPEYADQVKQVEEEMINYMERVINNDEKYKSLKDSCRNRDRSCFFWVSIGECEKNPEYMQKMCAPACKSCHVLDYQHKCPVDKNAPVALQPHDLNALFEKIVTDNKQYSPAVLSKPNATEEGVVDGPWVVVLENFITEKECDRLVELGHETGFHRSGDVGARNFDGSYAKSINSGRTSTNTFCMGKCEQDPATQNVTRRIENITGIPEVNYEFLQILRYEEGQFYDAHHDYGFYHLERQFGPRIITFFLYLNDVDEGGETEFPLLGLKVTPKKGKALLWPSVLDEDPLQIDYRTRHGALTVTKGVKYGANAWIHQGDFKTTHAKGCAI